MRSRVWAFKSGGFQCSSDACLLAFAGFLVKFSWMKEVWKCMGELREGMRRRDKCSFGYSPRGGTCAEKQYVVELRLTMCLWPFDPFPLEKGAYCRT